MSKLFREQALQRYIQQKEKTVLPQWISPPIFLFLWILLGLLILAGIAAWVGEVPVTVSGAGMILVKGQQNAAGTAIIFLPISQQNVLRPGSPIKLQLESGQTITAVVKTVEPKIISPSDARKRFSLGSDPCRLSISPAVIVMAQLDKGQSSQSIDGSCATAQVQVGSRRLISLLFASGS